MDILRCIHVVILNPDALSRDIAAFHPAGFESAMQAFLTAAMAAQSQADSLAEHARQTRELKGAEVPFDAEPGLDVLGEAAFPGSCHQAVLMESPALFYCVTHSSFMYCVAVMLSRASGALSYKKGSGLSPIE